MGIIAYEAFEASVIATGEKVKRECLQSPSHESETIRKQTSFSHVVQSATALSPLQSRRLAIEEKPIVFGPQPAVAGTNMTPEIAIGLAVWLWEPSTNSAWGELIWAE